MKQSPLVMELVGLAGSGKTSLAKALCQRNDKFELAPDIRLRNISHLLIFVAHFYKLYPLWVRNFRNGGRFAWDEIKALIYLQAWPSVFSRPSLKDKIIILDHGAIFKLATLHAFGPRVFQEKDQTVEAWWQEILARWAEVIEVIVLLEAPFEIMFERINKRDQRHLVKGESKRTAHHFLERYQKSYDQVLCQMSVYSETDQLRFDTSKFTAERIVDQVLKHKKLMGNSN